MLLDYNKALKEKVLPPRKTMVKKGTLDIDVAAQIERKIDIVDHRPIKKDEPKR